MALAAAMEMTMASAAAALAMAARDCDRCKMFAKQITIFIWMPFREECEPCVVCGKFYEMQKLYIFAVGKSFGI